MMKIEIRTAKTTSRTMTRPSLQGYFVPPHCKAMRRHMIAGRKITVPRGSSCKIRALRAIGALSFSGVFKKRTIPAKVILPIGRLM
jgi:hypothetical protein